MKKVAVIGYPVKHSLSPLIHNYWINKYGIDAEYGYMEVRPENLENTLRNLGINGYSGCNLTVPHKVEAAKIVDKISDVALVIGAVNTIAIHDGFLYGDNTDAVGFFDNIINYVSENNLKDSFNIDKAVIIGAGGAAKAVAASLAASKTNKEIVIVNRTKSKAQEIREHLAFAVFEGERHNSDIKIAGWDELDNVLEGANLLVNTTILGMVGQETLDINLDKLPKEALVNDIVYKPLETDLLRQAKKRGNKVVDGLGMLLYQAVGGFELWFGIKPEVTKELRQLVEKASLES